MGVDLCKRCGGVTRSEDLEDGLCPDCLEDKWEEMTEDIVVFGSDPDSILEIKKKERISRQFPLWDFDLDNDTDTNTDKDDTIALFLLYILVLLIGLLLYFIILPILSWFRSLT